MRLGPVEAGSTFFYLSSLIETSEMDVALCDKVFSFRAGAIQGQRCQSNSDMIKSF